MRDARHGLDMEVTYVTVTDHRYFIAAVALVNSLRVSGNDPPIVVIDAGLTKAQRASMSSICEIRPLPVDSNGSIPAFFKPTVHLMGLKGAIVIIDSDMIVTRRLDPILDEVLDGKVCAFVDQWGDRRFDEWKDVLELEGDLRYQPHINTGFVGLRLDLWEPLLQRWWELCDRIRTQRTNTMPTLDVPEEYARTYPFAWADQDVLNAILMSEVPEERIRILDLELAPGPPQNDSVRIADRKRLRCVNGPQQPYLLHYWNYPKPWFPGARQHLAFDAYVDLMARLLTADDVPIRLRPRDVPVWLRDTLGGRLVRRAPRRIRRTVRQSLQLLPEPLERRARDFGGGLAARVRLG